MTVEFKLLPDIVDYGQTHFADEPALMTVGRGRQSMLTYAQLASRVEQGAATLVAADLPPGTAVLLTLTPGPDWAVAFFAILKAGLIVVPILNEMPVAKITAIARQVQARAAVTGASPELLTALPDDLITFTDDALLNGDGGTVITPHTRAADIAVLAFTSGSTRQPRAVELTHANLLADLKGLLALRRVQPGDAFLSMLPPAHLFELVGGLLGPLSCGARIVYPGMPLPNRLVDALREQRITHALAVPALLDALYWQVIEELVEAGILSPAARDRTLASTVHNLQTGLTADVIQQHVNGVRARIGPSLHTLIVGGAALNPDWLPLCTALGIRLEVGYGLTEAAPVVSLGVAGDCPAGSVGRPLPGIKVRLNDHGEILVRGDNVMHGYYQDPAATQVVLDHGWLHTGDLGRLDDQGFLYVTGRSKEAMVTAAGETLYPEEIEPYYQHSLFAEYCVVPLAGADGNDLLTLLLLPASASIGDDEIKVAVAELSARAPARCRVAAFRRLDRPLPRTPTGKIQRRALAQVLNHEEEQYDHTSA